MVTTLHSKSKLIFNPPTSVRQQVSPHKPAYVHGYVRL